MAFNNTSACLSWLQYINTRGKSGLLGPMTQNVVRAAEAYEVGIPHMSYIAEFPLAGKPGVDLSASYYLQWFQEQNLFQNHPAQADGEFLRYYASRLNQYNPQIVETSSIFLEADSSKEKMDSYGLFIVLAGNFVSKLLPEVLQKQRLEFCLSTVEQLLSKAMPHLQLWYLGFMHSRPHEPLRLSLVGNSQGLQEFLEGAKAMGLEDFVSSAVEIVKKLMELDLFENAYLSLDILEDGSLGEVVGLDLQPKAFKPGEQRALLEEEGYRKLYKLLQEWGLADERIEALPDCVFSNEMSGEGIGQCELHSFLSHLKLRWRGKEALPVKAYLQMKTIPKQRSINDIFR